MTGDGRSDPTSVEQPVDPEADGDTGWLNFVHSRAGTRIDRREARRERRVVLAVLLVVMAVIAGVLVWRPWTGRSVADTGAAALGADRVAMLLAVSDGKGAIATAVLEQDRRNGGSGAVVAVPSTLNLSVEGVGTLSVHDAEAGAGPSLTQDALGSLLGVPLVGTWAMSFDNFAGLVDRLGGITVGGVAASDAKVLLAHPGDTNVVRDVAAGFADAFPSGFNATRTLLGSLGVLDGPGLPVPRLAAVLSGLSREAPAGHLRTAALPLDTSGHNLDPAGAPPIITGILGGVPGQGRTDPTPRIAVSLGSGAGLAEGDAQADVLGAGYQYVAGPAAAANAVNAVVVRTGTADALKLGAAIAALFNLPTSVVRVGADVPLGADVSVTLAKQP
jgi:hypothetical protein